MQQQTGGGGVAARRRLSVPRGAGAAAVGTGASVWETRMKMDEVKGGVKVFSAGGDDADEEGLRVYRRLRRNQSDGGGGASGSMNAAAAAAKKRRNWKASEPVTAIGDLRKSRSDVAAAAAPVVGVTTVTAKRSVTRVTTPEKKVAASAAAAEVKEVVVVEVSETNNLDEETEEEDDEEELEEELEGEEEEEEEEKEVLDQDHMAIDDDEAAKSTAPNQVDDQDLEPPTKRGVKIVPTSVEDERAANPEPVKPPVKKLATTIDLRAMNPEPMSIPPVEKKAMPVVIYRMTNSEPAKPSPEKKGSPLIGRRIPKQDPVSAPPVDLVMWRDVSKSTLVFGLGTFLLISSSYAKDLNYNTITAASYLGLVYLGVRFLSKSILNRGESVDCDDAERSGERYLVGEEEAIWLLRLVLPYINEVLLNLRSLFSGEPATTMKLALLLFAMARCGNFVTLWTLAKLVFFGVFIIPKVCSSYSTQLARYGLRLLDLVTLVTDFTGPPRHLGMCMGRFWLERFRDGWESCSHKKAVVATVFTLVWNVSSTVARVWAVFMLVVAMKCYQQRMMEYGWSSTVEDSQEATAAATGDDESPQEESPARSSPAKAHDHEPTNGFGTAASARHRRTPVSGEFARERLRVRGGIQPR
uniref:Reticulon-like protein n=1 Tax=Oryza punctata TaxID=4537 RepID=A0A0E0LTA1_ORYPU